MSISVSSSSGNAYALAQTQAQTEPQTVSGQDKPAAIATTGATASASASSVTVSWLAQQLSAAESRAQTRDASLGRKALGEAAATIVDQIAGDTWYANKAVNDAELPGSDDPQALALAKQATAFANGTGSNPFKGMSRDQLDAIAYDDSGKFTVNERHAAWQEAYDQEEAWRVKVIAEGELEYQTTGKQNNFFSEVLKHYQGLPAIEQAQYPADYGAQLQHWIDLDFNFRTNRPEGSESSHQSLVESLLTAGPYGEKTTESAAVGTVTGSA